MPVSKVGLFVIVGIVAALAAGAAYVFEETAFGSDVKDTLKHPTGLLTKVGIGGKEYATVSFSAELILDSAPALQFSFKEPAGIVSFTYYDPQQKLMVGDLALSSSDLSVVKIGSYKGSLSLQQTISFNGRAEDITYNANDCIGCNTRVSGSGVKYAKAELAGLPRTTLSFASVKGTVKASTETEEFISKVNGPLQINDFQGSLAIEDNKLILNGVGALQTSLLRTK